MVLRRIFRRKMHEVTGEWRQLQNEKFNDRYSTPNIIQVIKLRRIRWVGHAACMQKGRIVYRVLVGTPEGKRTLGRFRHQWEYNFEMDLQKVGWWDMNWIDLAQNRGGW